MPSKIDCSKLSATIMRLALNIGADARMKSLADVTTELQKHIPEISRKDVVDAIVEATTGHAVVLDEVSRKLNDLKREARSDTGLRKKIGALEANLREGTVPEVRRREDRSAEAVTQLREISADLQKQVRGSEPAVRERLVKQIDGLTQRLEAVAETAPARRTDGPMSKELERLAYQRDRLRQDIRDRINQMRPRGFLSWAQEPFNVSRAVMLGVDFGQVLRQGKFAAVSHPILTAKNIGPMLRAFAREGAEAQIMAKIGEHDLAPLAKRAGLEFTQGDAGLYKQEEAFRGILADRIPVLKNFNSAYRTFLNKTRFDLFVSAAKTLGRGGEVTLAEARVLANAINVSTGRGKVHDSLKGAMVAVNHLFLAPQYQISRLQALTLQPIWGGGPWRGTGRARLYVAKEYARTVAGLGVYYGLLHLASEFMARDDKERPTVELDPRSSDLLKVKIGDTRIDPLAGVGQWAVAAARLGTGETKSTRTGRLSDLRGKGHQFGQTSAQDVGGRFFRGRLAPAPGAIWDRFIAGKTPEGDDPTALTLMRNLFTPVTPKEIYQNLQDEGVERGTALGFMSLFGEGVQRYRNENR